jgi:hypothetical protein
MNRFKVYLPVRLFVTLFFRNLFAEAGSKYQESYFRYGQSVRA